MTFKKNTTKRSVWFIDLDDTLHDAANGTLKNIDLAMTSAIENLLRIDKKKADFIRKKYWIKYGATVVGLNKLHNVHFLQSLDVQNYLPPCNLSYALSNLSWTFYSMHTRIL